jgi:dihydrofolate reductase
MRRLVVGTFLTLDGVMQAPGAPDEDRSGGFTHGGWLVPHFDEAVGVAMDTTFARAEALLIGRRTYDIFAAYWPRVTDPDDTIATKLNAMPKYVASRTLRAAGWPGTSVLRGDASEAVAELKEQPGGEILVQGSGNLVQTLLRHDLIDEFRLLVFPVLLGSGIRLFGDGTMPAGLRLVHGTTSPSGVVLQTYERAGAALYGSVPPAAA